MNAKLCFRDDRGNLLMLDGWQDSLMSLFEPRNIYASTRAIQDCAANQIKHETGFLAATALLVCIDGGKK